MSNATRCLLGWLLLAPWAAGAGVPARQLTLGLVVPPNEPDPASLRRGAQMALAEANGAGQIPVRLAVRSKNGQWGTAGNEAVDLVFDDTVGGIIAPYDNATSHLILQVAGRTRIPVATLCPDSSVTDTGVPWAVRVTPRADQQAELLFTAIRGPDRPAPRWWAVVPARRAGRGVRRDLAAAAKATGTRLERVVGDGSGPTADLASLVRQVMQSPPAGVLLWLSPSRAGQAAAALRTAGYRGRLAGPCQLDSAAFLAAAGRAATGVMVAEFRIASDLREQARQFRTLYRRKFGVAPDFSAEAAHDAARLLVEALRRAGRADAFRQFPLTVSTPGVTGRLRFDGSGNRLGPLQLLTCRHDAFSLPPRLDQKR